MNIVKPITLRANHNYIALFVVVFIVCMGIIVIGSLFTSLWLNLILLIFIPAFILLAIYSKGHFTVKEDGLYVSTLRVGHDKFIPADSIYKVFHVQYFHYTVRATAEAVVFVDHNGKILVFEWGYTRSKAELAQILESFEAKDIVSVDHILGTHAFKDYVKEHPSSKTTAI